MPAKRRQFTATRLFAPLTPYHTACALPRRLLSRSCTHYHARWPFPPRAHRSHLHGLCYAQASTATSRHPPSHWHIRTIPYVAMHFTSHSREFPISQLKKTPPKPPGHIRRPMAGRCTAFFCTAPPTVTLVHPLSRQVAFSAPCTPVTSAWHSLRPSVHCHTAPPAVTLFYPFFPEPHSFAPRRPG